ncbi:nicotinate-nucleotide adenylyltransferase [Pseudooceanicola atlanticus]|jgi:nicotinate-nucleotide adenylyltransferase|uniref:Probable nicotinate-nucleotide adenylyltransferase n=1 Tax=Pseudooceanicola atlanticus TaxID=1461694 RepID=A0A0A0EKC5_9RHOB|nr:nicotinate-nucleotide adenylyltransferase [Pseudooceanicola atlanticus]KGM49632.1 nicotinate-nucleotide adenylyltransferase [Pseudooceanicola atlanticus]
MRYAIPHAAPGQVIGLLGGSFDPAHDGHAHITREALQLFGLDRVWWLVSPGNPLKARQPAPMADRIARARDVIDHPAVEITGIEAVLGTRYTAETLHRIVHLYPRTRFVWLMGADNLAQLDQWQDWRWIMENVPVGVLARPGDRISARMSKAARFYREYRLAGRSSHLLGHAETPAWCFVNVPMVSLSSTILRNRGDWSR